MLEAMRILFIRHGQTPANVAGILATDHPGPGLTELGEQQAAALPNALAPIINVIALNLAYLVTGVVIVEVMFRYQGFGWVLVEAAGNNDIDMLLSCSIVSVLVVLSTQMISDIGYAYLNPRIRVR